MGIVEHELKGPQSFLDRGAGKPIRRLSAKIGLLLNVGCVLGLVLLSRVLGPILLSCVLGPILLSCVLGHILLSCVLAAGLLSWVFLQTRCCETILCALSTSSAPAPSSPAAFAATGSSTCFHFLPLADFVGLLGFVHLDLCCCQAGSGCHLQEREIG